MTQPWETNVEDAHIHILCRKNFAEVIRNTENFSNFILGDHSDYCL